MPHAVEVVPFRQVYPIGRGLGIWCPLKDQGGLGRDISGGEGSTAGRIDLLETKQADLKVRQFHSYAARDREGAEPGPTGHRADVVTSSKAYVTWASVVVVAIMA